MKKILGIIALTLICTPLFGQEITGQWNGILNVMGSQLRLVFHIEQADSGYTATFDSPDQGANGIPFSSATFQDQKLRLEAPNIAAVYEGTLKADSIDGTWKQGGQSFPLTMTRKEVEKKELNRPQYPKKPYPYYEEEVFFENEKDSVRLAGTLTLPEEKGTWPAVILISGSGPQNRDEEVFGHKPFLVLADHLTRNGIAVLRYDDRGTAESTGDHSTATSQDFASDVLSAIAYLRNRPEINMDNIGLIGHSEGGIIAPMVANQSKDVAFIVLLAGTGVPGKEISLMQARTLSQLETPDAEGFQRFMEKSFDIASSGKDVSLLREELRNHYKSSEEVLQSILPDGTNVDAFIDQQVQGLLRPWARFFYTYNPADELKKLNVPVLSLNGSKDVQVTVEMNQGPIRAALEEAPTDDYLVKELPGLNHMFQESETGSITEYVEIEQTFAPSALNEITGWIKDHLR